MPKIRVDTLPAGALLHTYRAAGAYTDCYATTVALPVSLPEFMAAFYATPVFRLERWLLATFLGRASTEHDVMRLAQGQATTFAAWHVEARDDRQALLAAGRTRSWLMAAPHLLAPGGTTLYFGSAVVPRHRGGLGLAFSALIGFHRLYSRVLLGSAVRRLAKASA